MKITTRALVFGGILAGMAVVLKITSFTTPLARLTFYDIPLMIAGIGFGPIIGGIAGFIADTVYIYTAGAAFGATYGMFTVSSIIWGFVPGLLMMFMKKVDYKNIIIIVIITSILAFSVNTYALYIFYNTGAFASLPGRLAILVIKWPIQVFVLKEIYVRVLVQMKIIRES